MRVTRYMDGKIPVTADADTWELVGLMIEDAGGPFSYVVPNLVPLCRELKAQGISTEVVIVMNAEMKRK